MTMHIVGPWLSTTGKKKGKKKWASAEQKRNAEILAQQWEDLKKRHSSPSTVKNKPDYAAAPKTTIYRDQSSIRPASLNSWVTGAVNTKESPKYTGNKILGIGTMHKSNAVPIFNEQEAVDISRMRR